MFKTIDFNNESNIMKNYNNNSHDSFIEYSSNNNSSILKNVADLSLKNDSIPKIFKSQKLNSFLSTDINYVKTFSNSKIKKIKTFDRPIYNFSSERNCSPYKIKKYKKTEEILYHLTPSKQPEPNNNFNYSKISNTPKNRFNTILILNRNKRGNLNFLLNGNKKQYDYFPKLLDQKRACMLNKRNDKYKDRNILFSKLRELNFENEIRNTTKKNFITPDIYLSLNSNDNSKFLEKKTSYKILENINFRFKSSNDKSKLQKFTKNFNLFSTVNKFY